MEKIAETASGLIQSKKKRLILALPLLFFKIEPVGSSETANLIHPCALTGDCVDELEEAVLPLAFTTFELDGLNNGECNLS